MLKSQLPRWIFTVLGLALIVVATSFMTVAERPATTTDAIAITNDATAFDYTTLEIAVTGMVADTVPHEFVARDITRDVARIKMPWVDRLYAINDDRELWKNTGPARHRYEVVNLEPVKRDFNYVGIYVKALHESLRVRA